MTFGQYIRERRIAAGKSMREVAEAMDVTIPYVRQVEVGIRGPFLQSRWPALVAVTGADPAELARLARTEVERLRQENAELRAKLRRIVSEVASDVSV